MDNTNNWKEELNNIQCHFNWNIVKVDSNEKGDSVKDDYFFEDRLGSIDEHISDSDVRNLPQIYTTKGYFMVMYIQLLRKMPSSNKKKISDFTTKAEESFIKALEETQDNIGYKTVIYGNLAYFYKDCMKDEEESKVNFDLHKESLNDLTNKQKQEIIVMKAYTLSYSFKYLEAITEYEKAITEYEKAIKNCNEDTPAEWYFGLAFAKQKIEIGKQSLDSARGKEIEDLYRKCITLDPQYFFAKLRLARILWDVHGIKNIVEIEDLINEVTESNPENNFFLEEAASLLRLTAYKKKQNLKKVIELYKESERLNPKSPKTLRGLALYYRDQKEYEESIRYFKLLIEESGKYFEKTLLANVYIDATTNGKNDYEDNLKDLFEELETQCENESYRGKLFIWFSFSIYEQYKGNDEKEIYHLTRMIENAHNAEEDIYGEMKIIKESQTRLIKLAETWVLQNQGQISALKLKGKVYASQKNYLKATTCLQKAEEISTDCDLQLQLQETQVEYHFENYVQVSKSEETLLMKKIDELPDCSNVKWRVLIRKLIEDDHKELTSLMEIWKDFEEIENKSEKDIVSEKVAHDLIAESKSILEAAMFHIKCKVYPNLDANKKCAYPSPYTLKKKKMENIFERDYEWENFPTKLPNLFQFFVEKQDLAKYDWLENFFSIRNKGQHGGRKEVEKLFKEKYPEAKDQVNMVRKAAWYATDVCIEVHKKVKIYIENQVES